MASFWLLSPFIIIFTIIFPSSSSSTLPPSQPSIPTSLSSLAVSNSLPISTFQDLSPDIAPLLPSPGDLLLSPTASSLPTIPSTPSPPNPDYFVTPEPDFAFSPLGSWPVSSASLQSSVNLAVVVGCTAYCSLQLLKMSEFILHRGCF